MRIRHGLALVLALTGFVVLVASSDRDVKWARVCEDVVVQTGDEPLVERCRPFQLSDPPVLIGVGLFLILIADGFDEIAVPGLVNLKRRVAAQEAKQQELETSIAELTIQQAMASNVTNVYLSPSDALSDAEFTKKQSAEEYQANIARLQAEARDA